MRNGSSIPSPRHLPSSFSLPCWLLAILILFLSGCASSPRLASEPVAGGPSFASDDAPAIVSGQYADPSCNSFPLYEVFLVNTGALPRVFTAASLDGRPLYRPSAALLRTTSVSIDGFRYSLPEAAPDPDVVWWQFYPSVEAPPGGAVTLRLCLRGDVRTSRVLTVTDASGAVVSATIPRRPTSRAPLISAVSYSADLSRVFLLCDSPDNPPEALWVCGRRATSLRILSPSDLRHPFLATAAAPLPLRSGAPVWLRVRFADGRWRQALLRVLPGVSVYNALASGDPGSAPLPNDDDCPCASSSGEGGGGTGCGAVRIPEDPVCADLRSRCPGGSAWRVIRSREIFLASYPDEPAGVAFCTALTPQTAAIYGRIADGLFAKPYRLGWGHDLMRYLDEETDALAAQRDACVPLPFLYIPERFSRRGRVLSPAEAEALEWAAIATGAKGLRRHFAFNAQPPTPELAAVLSRTAAHVQRLQPALAPLLPVSDETQGDETSGYVRVLAAWAGPDGILFHIRDRSVGAYPDGLPPPRNIRAVLDIPPWFNGGPLRDLLTGETLAEVRPGRHALTLPSFRGFGLLWADADPSHPLIPFTSHEQEGE